MFSQAWLLAMCCRKLSFLSFTGNIGYRPSSCSFSMQKAVLWSTSLSDFLGLYYAVHADGPFLSPSVLYWSCKVCRRRRVIGHALTSCRDVIRQLLRPTCLPPCQWQYSCSSALPYHLAFILKGQATLFRFVFFAVLSQEICYFLYLISVVPETEYAVFVCVSVCVHTVSKCVCGTDSLPQRSSPWTDDNWQEGRQASGTLLSFSPPGVHSHTHISYTQGLSRRKHTWATKQRSLDIVLRNILCL